MGSRLFAFYSRLPKSESRDNIGAIDCCASALLFGSTHVVDEWVIGKIFCRLEAVMLWYIVWALRHYLTLNSHFDEIIHCNVRVR